MLLRDIAIYADDALVDRFRGGFVQRFHRETCCVVELFLSHLTGKVQHGKIAKVIVEFTDQIAEPPQKNSVKDLTDVVVMPWPFDFDTYVAADPAGKKSAIAGALLEALIWLTAEYGLNAAPFHSAYKASLEDNFELSGFLKKSWLSPSKEYRVRVFIRYELDAVELFAVLFRNRSSKELRRVRMGKCIPEIGCLNDIAAQGKWTSKTVFTLSSYAFAMNEWKARFNELRDKPK